MIEWGKITSKTKKQVGTATLPNKVRVRATVRGQWTVVPDHGGAKFGIKGYYVEIEFPGDDTLPTLEVKRDFRTRPQARK